LGFVIDLGIVNGARFMPTIKFSFQPFQAGRIFQYLFILILQFYKKVKVPRNSPEDPEGGGVEV
jgi:hypothetical protein